MQIHELNTKALTDPAYVAFDDGTDTYKADFNEAIDDAVAEAFSSADVSGGVVNYTSGDSSSPTAWADVSVMASGSTLATLMNRISTMVKNVRYIWSKIGSSSISNVSSTITGAIGNTSISNVSNTITGAIGNTSISGIGGGTLTGAVSTLNSKLTWSEVTLTAGSGITINTQQVFTCGNVLFVYMRWTASSSVSIYSTIATHGKAAKTAWNAPLMNDANILVSSLGLYADMGNTIIRAASSIPAGTYRAFLTIPI